MHYRFAHRTLRGIVEKDPGTFARLSARDDFVRGLTGVWDAMNEALPPEQRLAAEGLATCRSDDQNGRTIVIVTMPPAEHAAEAHFVGVVIDDESLSRYITLEHGWNLDDSPRTVLCEWTERGHMNFGDGPPADLDSFRQAVHQRLEPEVAGS
jgi:hypothetical protein